MLKHNYFVVGQNLLTSRQQTFTAIQHVTASPQKVLPPAQHQHHHHQQQGGGAGDDDWQQTISVLQTAGHAPLDHAPAASSKPLTKQLSRDLFPWLSERDEKTVVVQPALPHIAHKSSPLKVCPSVCSLQTVVFRGGCVFFLFFQSTFLMSVNQRSQTSLLGAALSRKKASFLYP